MREIFLNTAFRRLFAANVTSQLGSIVGNMAFAFYLLDRFSGQPSYATLAELMYAVPTLLVFFVVGVLADRLDRKRICAYSDWIRMGLTVVLFAAIRTDWMPLVFGVLFLRSAVGKFFEPAEAGLMQGILKPEHYTKAAGLNQSVNGVFMLFGTGLGALSYRFVGIEGAVVLDGISFLISGLLITSARFERSVRLPNGHTRLSDVKLGMVGKDFREGLRYIFRNKLLLAMIIGFAIIGFVNGAFTVLPMFTMKYKLAPGNYESYSSMFSVVLGIGVLIGSILGGTFVEKAGRIRALVWSMILEFAFGCVMAFTHEVWMFLVFTFLLGAFIAPVNIVIGGWLPEMIAPAYTGRVNAWIAPIMMLTQSAALGLIALLYPRYTSLEPLYVGVGACILVVSLWYALQLPKLARDFVPEAAAEPDQGLVPGAPGGVGISN